MSTFTPSPSPPTLTPLEMRDTQFRPRLISAADAYLDRLEDLIDGYGGVEEITYIAPALLVERNVVIQILAQPSSASVLNFPPRAQGNEPSLDPYARNIRDKERSLLTWQLRDYLRWLTGVLNGTSNYGSLDAEVGGELESERALIAQAIAFFTTEPSTAGFRSVPVPSTL